MKHTKHEQPDQPKPTPAPNSAPSNARRSPPEINADNSVKISTNSTPSHKQVGGFAAGNPWRFQPGRSGNPKGRPRQPGPKLLSEILRQGLTQPFPQDLEKSYAEVIASLILNSAGGGDLKAIAELLNRTEGRAPQSVGLLGLGLLFTFFYLLSSRHRPTQFDFWTTDPIHRRLAALPLAPREGFAFSAAPIIYLFAALPPPPPQGDSHAEL